MSQTLGMLAIVLKWCLYFAAVGGGMKVGQQVAVVGEIYGLKSDVESQLKASRM